MINQTIRPTSQWIRSKDVVIYSEHWDKCYGLESSVRHEISKERISSIFIEYICFPWTSFDNDTGDITLPRKTFYNAPPKVTIIRATVCYHNSPELFLQHFRDLKLTDVFLCHPPKSSYHLGNIRVHTISSDTSILEINGILNSLLKTKPDRLLEKPENNHQYNSLNTVTATTGKKLYVFTAAAFNYLPKAKLLAQSVRNHLPNAHLCLALSDIKPAGFNAKRYGFDSVISVDDLNEEFENVESWIFRHDVMELSTAIKPYVLCKLLSKPDCSAVLFLDPDCVMFGTPDQLIEEFNHNSILITPHQTKAEIDDRMMFREINHLRFGIYNLGFLGIKNDDEGKRFAGWWKSRLSKYCLIDLQSGLFTDQRWIDHVPVFFSRVKILRDSGYNVACWNFRDRLIQGTPPHNVTVDGMPVCFFHFAGTTGGYQKYMNWWGNDKTALQGLLEWYLDATKKMDDEPIFTRTPPYDCYSNGAQVTFMHRLIYREEKDFDKKFPNPYRDVGQGSYYEYVSKLNVPDYSRNDLLFGEFGKILHHVKKGIESRDILLEIKAEADKIAIIKSRLAECLK